MTPSAFTRYLETTHEQHRYEEIKAAPFGVEGDDMRERLEKVIRLGKPNKAVGPDGTHVEMLHVDPKMCADLLATWWTTVGLTGMFPEQLSRGTICPLYKKGPQNEPAKYRPVCLLSRIRKTVDAAVVTKLNDQYTPSSSLFRFQAGVAIAQDLLQVEDNANRGLTHVAVLDLEKAYDKVDRHLLLNVVAKWPDMDKKAMVRALLGPVYITAKKILLTMWRG